MLDKIDTILKETGNYIQEAQVFGESGEIYWHSSILDKNNHSLSAGFANSRLDARKIAIAEFLERKTCEELSKNPKGYTDWGFDKIPTACGFAAGFNKNNVIARSIAESAERWVMSKWIDEHYLIEKISANEVHSGLDPISKFFFKQFDEVLFFSKVVLVNLGTSFISINVAQTMGIKNGGIFPGSSAQNTGGSIWQHALLESFRHLLVIRNNEALPGLFPDNRVRYFAQHADIALAQIDRATKIEWPIPSVALHKSESFDNGDYFLARTILDGWKSWHDGPIDRFLY